MYSQKYRGDSTQDGVGSYQDQRSRTSYSSPPSDHVHRPVLVDAEGRKRPTVSFGTLPKAEVVGSVHSPLVSSENKEGMSTRVEPVKTYGGVPEEKWSKPSSPVSHPVEDKYSAYPIHANSVPAKTYGGVPEEKWGRPSSPSRRPLEDNRQTYPIHANGVPAKSGVPEEKWSRPSSPSRRPLEDNRKTYPIHANSVPAKTYDGVPEEKWSRPSSPNRRPLEDNRKTYPNYANGVPAKTYVGVPEEKWSMPLSPSHRPLEDNRKTYPNYANNVPAKTYGGVPEEKWSRPSSPSRRPLEDNRKTYPNYANGVQAKTYGGVPEEKWGRPSSPSRRPLEDNRKAYANGVPEERWNRPSSPSYPSLEDNRKTYPNYANGVPTKTYGGVPEETWSRPSNPSHHLEDTRKTYPNHPNGVPVKTYVNIPEEKAYPNHVNGRIANPPSMSDYKQNSPPRSYPVQPHRPSSPTYQSNPDHMIDEYMKKIQTEVSRPRFGPLSATYWRQTHQVTTGYGQGDELGHTPSEPPMITSGGWSRPSHATWASPPEGTLTNPTNDINTAVHFLLEATKPTSGTYPPSSRTTMPISNGSRPDVYGAPTIDNRDGARRYGNFNFSSKYPTIDSREAARRYGGANV